MRLISLMMLRWSWYLVMVEASAWGKCKFEYGLLLPCLQSKPHTCNGMHWHTITTTSWLHHWLTWLNCTTWWNLHCILKPHFHNSVLYITSTNLGIVMHFVCGSCVEMAFSSSSSPPVFLSFFTRLFTAFSDHLSSVSSFFQPNKRLTIGGVNVRREVILAPSGWTKLGRIVQKDQKCDDLTSNCSSFSEKIIA